MRYKTIDVPASPENEVYEAKCPQCDFTLACVQRSLELIKHPMKCGEHQIVVEFKPTGRHLLKDTVPYDTPEPMGTGNTAGA